ncbi:MAG: hypothetical protein WC222_11260 [Parachlamydiales bacterium]|jgi:hypothetical protein
MKLQRTDQIDFNEELHCYTMKDGGRILTPVSSVLDTLEVPFDREGKSAGMAKREILAKYDLTEMPVNDKDLFFTVEGEINIRAQALRDEWDGIGKESMDFGNWIDQSICDSLAGIVPSTELINVVNQINSEHSHYFQEFTQFMVFSDYYGICGTMDRLSLRGSRTNVVDITDYKTGLNKGMTYDNLKEKDGERKYYNKFYLEPLSHIEACSYARYTLQLSAYAFLLQSMYPEIKIGRLKICFVHRVDLSMGIGEPKYFYSYENIPVIYLQNDIQALFERIKVSKEMMGVQ